MCIEHLQQCQDAWLHQQQLALVDNLFDRFFLEFSRIFHSLYFFHSNPVLTLLNVY